MPASDSRVQYRAELDRELFERWKAHVPHGTPLYDRLAYLIRLDCQYDLSRLAERDPELTALLLSRPASADPDAAVVALQIRHRCMSAIPNAREHGADTAADNLMEIQERADALLEGV